MSRGCAFERLHSPLIPLHKAAMAHPPFQSNAYQQYGQVNQAGPSRPPPPTYSYGGNQVSGGYNPYANVPYTPAPTHYQTFGQSLFKPYATPEGYSYTGGYVLPPPQYQQSLAGYIAPEPPTKRQRLDGPGGHTVPAQAESAWRNCSIKGCKFVGSGKDVEVHEEDRHLIYAPGKTVVRSEEEERFARQKGSV